MRQTWTKAARFGLLIGLMILLPAAVLADPGPSANVRAESKSVTASDLRETVPPWDYGATKIPWGRLISGTLAVCALICVAVYVVKRLNGGAPLSRGRYLELLETRPVGRNVQLFLVKVAGKVVLFASSGGNVARVAELDEDDLSQSPDADGAGAMGDFKSLLRKLVRTRD